MCQQSLMLFNVPNHVFLPRHACDSHTCVKTKHNETMAIYFTSGTSGSPKMTGHTHSSFGLGLSINGRYSPTTNGSLRCQHCPGDDPFTALLDLCSHIQRSGLFCVSQVLAGSDPFGCDVEYIGHRLGQVRVEQCVFSVDPGSMCLCTLLAAV